MAAIWSLLLKQNSLTSMLYAVQLARNVVQNWPDLQYAISLPLPSSVSLPLHSGNSESGLLKQTSSAPHRQYIRRIITRNMFYLCMSSMDCKTQTFFVQSSIAKPLCNPDLHRETPLQSRSPSRNPFAKEHPKA